LAIGWPTQVPAAVQASLDVQAFESLHDVPGGARTDEHVPCPLHSLGRLHPEGRGQMGVRH